MSYSCGGPQLQFHKAEMPINQPTLFPSNPIMPPSPASPSIPMMPQAPTSPTAPVLPTQPVARPPVPSAPELIPNAPGITVPANPLLPPGYEEIIDYNSLQYLNGFLRTQIGRYATIEFLIGSNSTIQKSGLLVGVGLNYVILQDTATNDFITCDFYSIKFINFPY